MFFLLQENLAMFSDLFKNIWAFFSPPLFFCFLLLLRSLFQLLFLSLSIMIEASSDVLLVLSSHFKGGELKVVNTEPASGSQEGKHCGLNIQHSVCLHSLFHLIFTLCLARPSSETFCLSSKNKTLVFPLGWRKTFSLLQKVMEGICRSDYFNSVPAILHF